MIKITSEETESLALLNEECGEVIQAVSKILRHGFSDSNKDDLIREISHVRVAMDLAQKYLDIT